MAKKRLLVTGASGFLGWNICKAAVERFEVYGMCHQHDVAHPEVTSVNCDLCSADDTAALIRQLRPSAIIHTAADSSPDHCHNHTVSAYGINVLATRTLTRIAAEYDMRFLFTSTDQVFGGTAAPYDENAIVGPVNIYGLQKAEAERFILSREADAMICRMPLMFGDSSPSYVNFITRMVQMLRDKKPLSLFTDQIRTPVSAATAAEGLLSMVDSKVTGLIHLGGRESVSRYDLGVRLAKFIGASESLIRKDLMADQIFDAKRPFDVGLNSEKAFALGYSPRSLEDEFAKLEDLK